MSTKSTPDSIGGRIRFVRAARGWTQTQLADLAGMKKAQLSRYEVGASIPRPEVLNRLATALGVSRLWLEDDKAHAINDDEVVDDGTPLVPLSPEVMEKLLALSTQMNLSITQVLEKITDEAFAKALREAASEAEQDKK